jgi:hypothetical protein
MAKTHDRRRPRPTSAPFSYRLVDLPPISGISLSGWRNMIAAGKVRAVRHGRVILVPREEVLRVTGAA